MQTLLSTVAVGVVIFATTNADDLLLLAAWFADPGYTRRQVIAGQLLGLGLLVAGSALGARLTARLPLEHAAWLGLAPLGLGLWKLTKLRRRPGRPSAAGRPPSRLRWLSVAALTIANGGDNVATYIPLFSSAPELVPVYAATFTGMTAAWCWLGLRLVSHPRLGARVRRWGHLMLPLVLIGFGALILRHARLPGP